MQLHNIITAASVLASLATAGPVNTPTALEPRQSKVRIMLLGDSITEIACWRALVWDRIAAAGLASQAQYVGSVVNNPQNCKPQTANWDQRHEGHSGWQAVDIAGNYITTWMRNTPADVVQVMLGTNDVNAQQSTTDIIAAYTQIVNTMRASNPNIKIIWDLVIPLASSANAGIVALNKAIPAWAAGLNKTESPLVIADCNAGFKNSMLRDGLHPNEQGDQLIASRVGPLILSAVRDVLGQ